MRMCILIGWRAVRGPTGMPKPATAIERLMRDQRGKALIDLAGFFVDLDLPVASDSQPCAVIAAIFESAQPVQENWRGLLFPYITDDSTHTIVIDKPEAKAKL